MVFKRIRRLIMIVAFCILGGYALTQTTSLTWQAVTIIVSAIVGALVTYLFESLDTHGQGFITWFKSQIRYRKKDLYLSFAYLYKIEIDGKYLLIRGHRMRDRLQAIGGVYKYYPEAKRFLNSIGANPDTSLAGNTDETDDLRLTIKGQYLLKFMDWFTRMEDREYSPEREFYEELIQPGWLPEDLFRYRHLQYRKVGTHNVGITKSPVANSKPEVIYADIFEVSLDDTQKEAVGKALTEHSDELYLASRDEILNRRTHGSVAMDIANNVLWLIGEV